MLFSSTVFIYLFLPIVLIIYYGLLFKSRTCKNIFLFIASIFFYAWGEPKFVLIMLGSILLNWLFGILVHISEKKPLIKKIIVILAVVLNLSLLFNFKYLNFSESIICSILGKKPVIPEIALPIGISFFTFQAMSYVIDVYRGRGTYQKNIINVGLYISFFPQLIAGPIVRYETVAEEIKGRKTTANDFFDGFARFIVGLSKKVLLANSFGILADKGFLMCREGMEMSVMFSWLCVIAYTLQIFFDFCGYSDMAIGLGRMFGFHFLENFNYPYISKSISEFWRRWHISLGTWFKDYVYIPLGGNRVGKYRLVINLFVVWFLTGLWHGASWTFVIWGILYFTLLMFEKLVKIEDKNGTFIDILKRVYTLFFVMIGWVFFRSDSLILAWEYIKSMLGLNKNVFFDGMFTGYFYENFILLTAGIILSTPIFKIIKEKIKENYLTDILCVLTLVVLFVLSVASLVSDSYNPFIYFNF